jgi:hypothetical protein
MTTTREHAQFMRELGFVFEKPFRICARYGEAFDPSRQRFKLANFSGAASTRAATAPVWPVKPVKRDPSSLFRHLS